MWDVNGNDIKMTEGDYGVALTVTFDGITFAQNDNAKFTIKKAINGETVIDKTFSNITQNKVSLELTEAESALIPVGNYVYLLDWYQSGSFHCNLIPWANFKVGEKA